MSSPLLTMTSAGALTGFLSSATQACFFDDVNIVGVGGNAPPLSFSKTNPSSLTVGVASNYQLTVTNTGSTASSQANYFFSERLPPNVQFNNVSVQGGVAVASAACAFESGTDATGLLYTCAIAPTSGSLPAGGSLTALINVTPKPAAQGQSLSNRARLETTGSQSPTPANYNPDSCTGTNLPVSGCVKTTAVTVAGVAVLGLSKANPGSLAVGAPSDYSLTISNTGSAASGTTLDVYEQLPPNVKFNSGAGVTGGSVTPSGGTSGTGVTCSVVSGTVAAGQLLKCTVSLPSGIPASTGTANFTINVTPQSGVASSVVNKARIDTTGANAAQTPSACTATGSPAGCAVTAAQPVGNGVNLSLSKSNPTSLAVGVASDYTFTITNNGTGATGNPLDVYEQLPPNVQFNSGAGFFNGSNVRLVNSVDCSFVVSGTPASGELRRCRITLNDGLPAPADTGTPPVPSTTSFKINVTPLAGVASSVVNKARIDPTGLNAAQSPSACTATGSPAGCAVTPSMSVGNRIELSLSKTSPASGSVAALSSYTLQITNNGSATTGTSLTLLDQLPQNMQFFDIAPSSASCSVSGSASTNPGQLLTCTVGLAGGLAPGATAVVTVRAQALVSGTTGPNKASVDPLAGSAAPTPSTCTATGTPAGCAVSPGVPVSASGPVVTLRKSAFPLDSSLKANVVSTYRIAIGNNDSSSVGPAQPHLEFYDLLWPGFNLVGASVVAAGSPSRDPAHPTTSVAANTVSCSAVGGSVAAGLLVKCVVDLPGMLTVGQNLAVDLQVLPGNSTTAFNATNKARIDATGFNAAQTSTSVSNCSSTGAPMGCAVTTNQVSAPSLTFQLTFNTLGGNNTFAINAGTGGNGFTATNLTTTGATGTPVQGTGSITPQSLNTGASTVPFGVPAGWSATTGSCTVNTSGGVAAPGSATFAGTASTGTFSFDATATAAGNVISCQATLVKLPTLQLSVWRQTGSGALTFTTQPSATAGNGYTAQSFATTGASPSAVPGSPNPTQVLAAASSPTQLSLSGPAGWVISSASCVDTNSAASGNPAATFDVSVPGGTTLALIAGQVPAGANLVCTAVVAAAAGPTVSGLVLQDNGAGGGTAHDGIKNGAEVGRPGATVTLDNCSGTTYASAVTDGEGRFSLSTAAAAPGPVCLVESSPGAWLPVSNQVGNTAGSFNAATRRLSFTLTAGTDYSGIVFGEVPISLLSGDGHQHLQPGQSVVYGHGFTAGSSASVVFSTADQPSQSGAPWTSTLYLDSQCNASLDAADTVLTGPVSVTAGQTVCLLVRVFSPASATNGSTDQTTLTATETYQPTPQVGPVVRVQSKTDVTTVGVNASGALTLVKEVRKVASCPSSVSDTLPFSASNTAMPGSFLEYRLSYTNGSGGPVTGIQISDTVPAYTGFRSAGCGTVSNGLATCSVTDQPALGATGPLVWKLTDSSTAPIGLQSGGSGSVVFCVLLSN